MESGVKKLRNDTLKFGFRVVFESREGEPCIQAPNDHIQRRDFRVWESDPGLNFGF